MASVVPVSVLVPVRDRDELVVSTVDRRGVLAIMQSALKWSVGTTGVVPKVQLENGSCVGAKRSFRRCF